MMITQTKDQYISPECEVVDTELEGVIAASPDVSPTNPFSGNTENEW